MTTMAVRKEKQGTKEAKKSHSYLTERRGSKEVRLFDNSSSVWGGGRSSPMLAIAILIGSPGIMKGKY